MLKNEHTHDITLNKTLQNNKIKLVKTGLSSYLIQSIIIR